MKRGREQPKRAAMGGRKVDAEQVLGEGRDDDNIYAPSTPEEALAQMTDEKYKMALRARQQKLQQERLAAAAAAAVPAVDAVRQRRQRDEGTHAKRQIPDAPFPWGKDGDPVEESELEEEDEKEELEFAPAPPPAPEAKPSPEVRTSERVDHRFDANTAANRVTALAREHLLLLQREADAKKKKKEAAAKRAPAPAPVSPAPLPPPAARGWWIWVPVVALYSFIITQLGFATPDHEYCGAPWWVPHAFLRKAGQRLLIIEGVLFAVASGCGAHIYLSRHVSEVSYGMKSFMGAVDANKLVLLHDSFLWMTDAILSFLGFVGCLTVVCVIFTCMFSLTMKRLCRLTNSTPYQMTLKQRQAELKKYKALLDAQRYLEEEFSEEL